MSVAQLYSATEAGNRFESTPTESFLPQMKYDSSSALPTRLMLQNARGIVGRPCLRVASTCTTHRPAKSSTPRYPTIFQGVTTTPKNCPMIEFIDYSSRTARPGLYRRLSHM